MGAYVVYLVLVFGGSSTSSVSIPQASLQDCHNRGAEITAKMIEARTSFKYLCVESLK